MHFEILADHEVLSRAAAAFIRERLRARPDLLLCAATGATPTRTYDLLADEFDMRQLAAQLRVLKLDEWGGLAMDDPATCEVYLHQHLLGPLGVTAERYLAWNSDATDPGAEVERMRRELQRAGPIDLCVLGLGRNGHLGFNEPGEKLTAGPHVAALAPESLTHSMLSAARGKPTHGLTLGIGDIGAAREVLLLVSGAAKREQLHRLQEGLIETAFPASMLWGHPRVRVMCDRAAT